MSQPAPCAEGPDVVGAPRRHVPGEPGVWILIFGDILVFTILFVVYLDRRGHDELLFAQSQDTLNRTLGAVNTLAADQLAAGGGRHAGVSQ